jgi:glutathione peroxidase
MKKMIIRGLLLAASITGLLSFSKSEKETAPLRLSFYDLSIKSLDGKSTINFKDFEGKKVLCVNTASECGFTRQYRGLQALADKYKDKLVVIGFPCNQFGGQEPRDPEWIGLFCSERYGVSFPLSEKVYVKGDSAHIVFQWLTQKKNNKVKDVKVRWNFGKFLVDEKGRFMEYFPSEVEPNDPALVAMIEK